MDAARVGLGQLLLALDRTMVTLVQAPRGLDLPVGSVALVDADDARLGLPVGAGNADVFFLVGVPDDDAVRWIGRQVAARVPAALFVKQPTPAVVDRAVSAGAAVVAVEPRARWERLYRLVDHVFEHHGDRADAQLDSGTDLFGLASSIAERTHAMVSIEDAQSHVLAYSASNDEADELRRLSILGRAGPAEHMKWISQWGIFDALRAGSDVVRVAERPELGLRPRLAIGIHRAPDDRRGGAFLGTIWLQQGSRPFADDVEQVLRGAAVLAERIMSRLAAAPSLHALRIQEILGFSTPDVDVTFSIPDVDVAFSTPDVDVTFSTPDVDVAFSTADVDVAAIAGELGIAADGRAALVAVRCLEDRPPTDAIALSATAFRPDALVTARDGKVYVLFPQTGGRSTVVSWVRGTVSSLRRELGLALQAVIAAPLPGLVAVAAARAQADRVFGSADRHPGLIGPVASLDEARTIVLLDEIVALVAGQDGLVDPRLHALRDHDTDHHGSLLDTLRAYLDCFGDIAAAGQWLHVHPNTVRYRVRRIEKLLGASLADPDDRLVLALGLRAMPLVAPRRQRSARR